MTSSLTSVGPGLPESVSVSLSLSGQGSLWHVLQESLDLVTGLSVSGDRSSVARVFFPMSHSVEGPSELSELLLSERLGLKCTWWPR